jgi:hypothetical protein
MWQISIAFCILFLLTPLINKPSQSSGINGIEARASSDKPSFKKPTGVALD